MLEVARWEAERHDVADEGENNGGVCDRCRIRAIHGVHISLLGVLPSNKVERRLAWEGTGGSIVSHAVLVLLAVRMKCMPRLSLEHKRCCHLELHRQHRLESGWD